MANMVDAAWAKAMACASRGLSVAVLIVFFLARSAGASVRRWGWSRSSSAGRLPPVGQQFLDSAVQLRGQPCEHVLEVSPGLVPFELGRLQQAHHDSSSLAGQLTSNEEPISATEGPRPNPVLTVVIVDRHIAVQKVSAKPHPVVQVVNTKVLNPISV